MLSYRFNISVLISLCAMAAALTPVFAEDIKVECLKAPVEAKPVSRKDVYAGMPFQQGEKATYEVTWAGLKAGYGTMEVRRPLKYKGLWHRVFHVDASTGDWFKTIFVAKDKVDAYSQPHNFGVAKFYIEQNEGKIFSAPLNQKKWLEFDHKDCKVHERTQKAGKDEQVVTHAFAAGAMDALGVVYYLRTRDYKVGKVERAPVYSSEKNWWLEAEPLGVETVEVPAGSFQAMKLKLATFLGQDLQQQGDVHIWIATDHPQKPLVQVQGDIKIGNVWMKLHAFEK